MLPRAPRARPATSAFRPRVRTRGEGLLPRRDICLQSSAIHKRERDEAQTHRNCISRVHIWRKGRQCYIVVVRGGRVHTREEVPLEITSSLSKNFRDTAGRNLFPCPRKPRQSPPPSRRTHEFVDGILFAVALARLLKRSDYTVCVVKEKLISY